MSTSDADPIALREPDATADFAAARHAWHVRAWRAPDYVAWLLFARDGAACLACGALDRGRLVVLEWRTAPPAARVVTEHLVRALARRMEEGDRGE